MKNLSTDLPLDNHLKVVKDFDGTSSALEISKDKVRVKDLEITGLITGTSHNDNITIDTLLGDGSTNPVQNNAVFDGLATKLNLSGGTMSGTIDCDDNRVTNVNRISFGSSGSDGFFDGIKDEDDMASDSASYTSTQQSIKAYVDDKAPSGAYSTTVLKVMPTEFMVNDDYSGGRAANIIENDTADTLGYRMANASTEGYAFVKIPEGYKATRVTVHASASTSNAVECKTFNYTTGATTDLETFDFNTDANITDVTASTTNDLVIKILPASTSTIIYGALVVIAVV